MEMENEMLPWRLLWNFEFALKCIIVNTGDTKCESGCSVAPKKNFEVICGALAQFKVKLTGAML